MPKKSKSAQAADSAESRGINAASAPTLFLFDRGVPNHFFFLRETAQAAFLNFYQPTSPNCKLINEVVFCHNRSMSHSDNSAAVFPIHVLVVDDHPNTAHTLARAIAQIGSKVEVLSAISGQEALQRVQDCPVDILITDMVMPQMNGIELIERLQNHPGGKPSYIILITAYDMAEVREAAQRMNINEIIIKPVNPEHLYETIEKLVKNWSELRSLTQEKQAAKPYKVLIADDRPDNVLLLSRYMENEGYTYITAVDGVEALDKIRAELPDLVLLDVSMPRKDGFEVLREMRADAALPYIPVIILTAARVDPVDVQAGFSLGADDYITKPFDRHDLLARIRTKLFEQNLQPP
ncbi:MAG: response regulator [Anaerolineales bacterium]